MFHRIKKYLQRHGVLSKNSYKMAYRQYSRFLEYSTAWRDEDDAVWLETNLRILVHELEKGFSLPMPRKGFGREKVRLLAEYYKKYKSLCENLDEDLIDSVQAMLVYYCRQKDQYELDVSRLPEDFGETQVEVGIKQVKMVQLDEIQTLSFPDFAMTRHSIRIFKDAKVDRRFVQKAVQLAQTAPSACNRQSVEIFHVQSLEKCCKIVALQGGFKGSSPVHDILLVTSNLSAYTSLYELNTCYVDGGLFAMNLIYALHYYGIGSCPLLWNDDQDKREKIRAILDIPMENVIVLLLPIGYYEETGYKYAVSHRKPIESIFHIRE